MPSRQLEEEKTEGQARTACRLPAVRSRSSAYFTLAGILAYSTCSGEAVVQETLKRSSGSLRLPQDLPAWPHRTNPQDTKFMGGFLVAIFEHVRVPNSESQEQVWPPKPSPVLQPNTYKISVWGRRSVAKSSELKTEGQEG